jgi:hypothetical protein
VHALEDKSDPERGLAADCVGMEEGRTAKGCRVLARSEAELSSVRDDAESGKSVCMSQSGRRQ